ncbi:hypothetical protein [Rubrobacter aplysinae]|uniref:hypothetical protein n=1 Tax=Rubrobacter aplysinae TaxID=909625 RepID=UPI00064C0B0C|nr:hypothetical protein [Rubrobacter aplysinae]
MMYGGTRSWPLWARLLFIALPAGALAAVALGISLTLTATLEGSPSGADAVLAAFYCVARNAARVAVLAGSPVALVALIALLLIGGYRDYPVQEGSEEPLPTFLGRAVAGCAVFAGVGLVCQIALAAQLGGWSPF